MHWLKRIFPFRNIGRIFFNGKRNEKRIALTFDDGPSQETKQVLKILKKYNAKGTFFVLGKKIDKNKKILTEIIKNKSEIGNHSYSHSSLILKSKKFIVNEISETDEKLKKLKIETKLLRPPFGNIGYNFFSVAGKIDKKIILWDLDPRDYTRPGIKIVANRVLKNVKDGSIIDLHDYIEEVGRNKDLVGILKIIIPKLQRRGYKFITVSELLELN